MTLLTRHPRTPRDIGFSLQGHPLGRGFPWISPRVRVSPGDRFSAARSTPFRGPERQYQTCGSNVRQSRPERGSADTARSSRNTGRTSGKGPGKAPASPLSHAGRTPAEPRSGARPPLAPPPREGADRAHTGTSSGTTEAGRSTGVSCTESDTCQDERPRTPGRCPGVERAPGGPRGAAGALRAWGSRTRSGPLDAGDAAGRWAEAGRTAG